MLFFRYIAVFHGRMKSLSSGFHSNWGVNYPPWGQPAKAMYNLNPAVKLNSTGGQKEVDRTVEVGPGRSSLEP